MGEVALAPPSTPDSAVERAEEDFEYAATEIAAALTMTRRAAERELETAMALRTKLSAVWERMRDGHIGWRKMREFVRELAHRPQEVVDEVLDHTLDEAPDLTSGQLGRRIAQAGDGRRPRWVQVII